MKKISPKQTTLSVNVNKIALLRNSRGGNVPNLEQCCRDILKFGADGITVHPRPDGRHVREEDVKNLSRLLKKYPGHEFNVEGYPSAKFLKMLVQIRPDQATLVPDKPTALTSNAGWKLAKNRVLLKRVVRRLQAFGIRVSLFIDVFQMNDKEYRALSEINPDRVELYTEGYAKNFATSRRNSTLAKYKSVADKLATLGFQINAGHDLTAKNLGLFLRHIPQTCEVSIGHALISEALYDGLERTIQSYRRALPK